MKKKILNSMNNDFRNKIFSLKFTESEYLILKEKAEKYSDGNMGAYIRHILMNYKVTNKDLR